MILSADRLCRGKYVIRINMVDMGNSIWAYEMKWIERRMKPNKGY